jgi:hypothetical protein
MHCLFSRVILGLQAYLKGTGVAKKSTTIHVINHLANTHLCYKNETL